MVTKVTEQIYGQISELGNNKIWSGIIANVKAFGAKGDGSDDTEAIQKALNSGEHIFLPEPDVKYRVTKPLIVPPTVKKISGDNVHIFYDYEQSGNPSY